MAAFAAAGLLLSSNGSIYKPGNVRAEKGLRATLAPPSQEGVPADFWKVEEDIRLYHFRQGEGTPVLVLHGGPGVPPDESWPGLQALSPDFSFIYYHQRGCGRSSKPIDRFESQNFLKNVAELDKLLGFSAQLADIERIRRILKQDKLTLIGHSWGGFMAALYAVEFPEHVDKMVLIAPAAMLKMPDEGGLFEQIKDLLPESRHAAYEAFLRQYFDYGNIFHKSERDLAQINLGFAEFFMEAAKAKGIEVFTDSQSDISDVGGWMVHAQYFSLGMKFDHRPELKKVTVPVLVLHGEEDIIPSLSSREYAELFPAATFKLIPKASHFPFLETPAVFARLVQEFLKP
jgi:proline iminopeptidase